MSHTPGPWGAHIDRHGFVTLGAGPVYIRGPEDGFNVAGFMSAADARLIAAAPDLLAALEELAHIVEEIEIYGYAPNTAVTLDRAHAAIAKAKGK